MLLVLHVFDHKPKYWTNRKCYLMMEEDEKSEDQHYRNSYGDRECVNQVSPQTIQ